MKMLLHDNVLIAWDEADLGTHTKYLPSETQRQCIQDLIKYYQSTKMVVHSINLFAIQVTPLEYQ